MGYFRAAPIVPLSRGLGASTKPGAIQHASWLNQVEIVFSIIQKKVLTPSDFASTAMLSQTLLAFTDRYNLTARPFNWKFTANDLTALLSRISQHEHAPGGQQTDLPQAA